MRYTLIPAAAAMALYASAACAGDIMSCSYDLPPPPPPGAAMQGGMPAVPMHLGGPDANAELPPPPPPVAAPSVATSLSCLHGGDKTQATLADLSSQGWNLQTALPTPGSMTFYLTK